MTTHIETEQANINPISNSMMQPKSLYRPRKKKLPRTYINILHDPRVVRGNTYAAFVIPTSIQSEFLRLKEEEERKRRLLQMPVKLPRVATLARKKDDYFDEEEEIIQEDTEPYANLEEPTEYTDKFYFYEDRPPTPEYIPLPAGKEVETQIYPGDLFDFNTEVEPILEVLVGRSLLDAQYELYEEYERKEYLDFRRKCERKLELEVVILQKSEAAYKRKQEEKQRRKIQQDEKKKYDTMIQKKLYVKNMIKQGFWNTKDRIINQLYDYGFFKEKSQKFVDLYIKRDYHPMIDNYIQIENEFNRICSITDKEFKDVKISEHKIFMDELKHKRKMIQDKKDNEIREQLENERIKEEETKKRREWKRIERIKRDLNQNIINHKFEKVNIESVSISDIDDFYLNSENIHSIGGNFGLIVIFLNEILKKLDDNINKDYLITQFIEELLLNQFDDSNYIELKFLESARFDLKSITEERKNEYIEYMLDTRRFVNKSLEKLVEISNLDTSFIDDLKRLLVNIYFRTPQDPASIEVDPNNDDPGYQESITKQKNEMQIYNENIEKLKKKFRFTPIKSDILKRKRNNVCGFISIFPDEKNKKEFSITEIKDPIEVVNVNELKEDNIENDHNNQNEDEDKEKEEEVKESEPEIYTFEYNNAVQLLKNTTLSIDTYIIHYGAIDYFFLICLKAFYTILRKNKLNIDIKETFNEVRAKYSELNDNLVSGIIKSENYKGGKLINYEIHPPKEEVNLSEDDQHNSQTA